MLKPYFNSNFCSYYPPNFGLIIFALVTPSQTFVVKEDGSILFHWIFLWTKFLVGSVNCVARRVRLDPLLLARMLVLTLLALTKFVNIEKLSFFKYFFGEPHSATFISFFIEYVRASMALNHPVYGRIWTHDLLDVSLLP